MALPIDIPWKRMGVSKDLIDLKHGDLKFPQKWRSSISLFYHEPTDLPPEYCERRITYLKVSCTLSSYQASEDDVTILDQLRKGLKDFHVWGDFESRVTRAYPCYGALLQVGVYPHRPQGPKVPAHEFPYIMSLQPRKREMYEMLSQSGEMASKSDAKINVSKGVTNTETTEEYDVSGGGGGGSIGFGLVSWQGDQEQRGSVERFQTQDQDITTTDASREKRESHAYSTTLNQLYSLLDAYHVGTNRAVFFLQPRPHIQDMKFTFVRGLRRLEGIQDFFLVVNRPASVPGLCVEAALETAHLYLERAYRPRLIPASEITYPGNLQKTAQALGINLAHHGHYTSLVSTWNKYLPWVRHLVAKSELAGEHTYPKPVWDLIQNGQMTKDDYARMATLVAHLPEIGIENAALLFDEYEADSGWLFLTGRRLCACYLPAPKQDEEHGDVECEQATEDQLSTCDKNPGGIVFTKPFDVTLISNKITKFIPHIESSLFLNQFILDVRETLNDSLAARDRVPYGEQAFLETPFMLDEMAQLVRVLPVEGAFDRPLHDVAGIQPLLERGLGRTSRIRDVADLGRASTEAIQRDLDVAATEARGIRKNLLVMALKELGRTVAPSDAPPQSLHAERLSFRYPDKERERLIESALLMKESPRPKKQEHSRAKKSTRKGGGGRR